MNQGDEISSDHDMFIEFYKRNGLAFGTIDLLCMGSAQANKRLAALLSVLFSFRTREGRLPFSRVTVFAPPGTDETAAKSDISAQLDMTVATVRGTALSDAERSWLGKRTDVIATKNLEAACLTDALAASEKHSIVVIQSAAAFRVNGVSSYIPPGASASAVPEDYWAPHLHALALSILAAARTIEAYVVLDAGEPAPHRDALISLLQSVPDCGVVGTGAQDDPMAVLTKHIDRWLAMLATGRLGPVLKEIEAQDTLREQEKLLLRIQILHRSGLPMEALQGISEALQQKSELHPANALRLARIAEDAGASALAKRLLQQTSTKLEKQESLEFALAIAFDIGDPTLLEEIASLLEALYPSSLLLKRQRFERLVHEARYADAAAMLRESSDNPETAEVYDQLAVAVTMDGPPDYHAFLDKLSEGDPHKRRIGRTLCVQDALHRGLPVHAYRLCLPADKADEFDKPRARLLLEAMESLFLNLGPTGVPQTAVGDIQLGIAALLRYLANHPSDGSIRVSLERVLSVQVAGTLGLVLIASAILDLMRNPLPLRDPTTRREAKMDWLITRKEFLDAAFKWLSAESPVVLGRTALPAELVTEPADDVLSAVIDALQELGNRLDDVETLTSWLMLGVSIAPHSADPDQSFSMVRLVAGKLATMGRRQMSRDLCEQLLQQADNPRRARMAWFTFADVYQRVGNSLAALIGLGCALVNDESIDAEQAWYEMTGLVRVLRDIGLGQPALSVVQSARQQFSRFEFFEANQHRLDALELQVAQLELLSDPNRTAKQCASLLRKATSFAEGALRRREEPGPAAALLGQLIRACEISGVRVPSKAIRVRDRLLKRASPSTALLLQTMSTASPTAADVMSLLASTEKARYATDTGFDYQHVVMAAERLLDKKDAAIDPAMTTFAIELLADQAVATPGWETTAAPAAAPASIEEPAIIARAISNSGITVVMAGFGQSGKMFAVEIQAGALKYIAPATDDGLTLPDLEAWVTEFPYRYGVDETDPNIFLNSTEKFRLPVAPHGPILFVTDARLQQFPPNLLRTGDQFAGSLCPIASAPSLSWLRAARSNPRVERGTCAAWIPMAKTPEHTQTLGMIADRLRPTFDFYGVNLDTTANVPDHLSGADLAIVAAHGGIVPEGRYFQLIADDAELRLAASDLTSALRNVGVVILFVCSGGRADKHPASNTVVGLSKQLLDRGCSAVLASPWPLDARVTYHWLPAFLECCAAGQPIIEANFAANAGVAKMFPYDSARTLAMSVYGDPLMKIRLVAPTIDAA